MGAREQLVRFTPLAGREVAWAAVGQGPPIIVGGWWCSHLELDWRNDAFRRFLDPFAERHTLIRYDRPGTGLSDRGGPPITSLAEELAVLSAMVDQVGERVTLFGASSGGCVSAAYAALYPKRVERLVLYGAYANGVEIAGPAARESVLGIVGKHWGVGSRLLADLFMPDSTTQERDEFVRFQRACATPETAVASLSAVYEFDVRSHLPNIQVPTHVVHRQADRAIPFELGRDVAARIPGASFVALDGTNHMPWLGDAKSVVDSVLRFLGDAPTAKPKPSGELSNREIDVLRLVARGFGDQEIAGELVLSVHTVHRHVANIRTKLGVASRAAAAAHAVRAGLI